MVREIQNIKVCIFACCSFLQAQFWDLVDRFVKQPQMFCRPPQLDDALTQEWLKKKKNEETWSPEIQAVKKLNVALSREETELLHARLMLCCSHPWILFITMFPFLLQKIINSFLMQLRWVPPYSPHSLIMNFFFLICRLLQEKKAKGRAGAVLMCLHINYVFPVWLWRSWVGDVSSEASLAVCESVSPSGDRPTVWINWHEQGEVLWGGRAQSNL